MTGTNRPSGIAVRLDPGRYLGVLSAYVARHVGDLRVVLRSLEDGSFAEKASASRPGKLLHFQVGSFGTPDAKAAAARLCNRCFVNIVAELLTYLDRTIAMQKVLAASLTVPQ